MAKTAYNKLQDAKKKHCDGKILKSKLNEVEKKYIDHSVKKGMPKQEAEKKAKDVVDGNCDISGTGKKRKSTAKVGGTGAATALTAAKKAVKTAQAAVGKLEKALKGTKAPAAKRKPAVKGTKAKKRR
jgi:hypothetical protein